MPGEKPLSDLSTIEKLDLGLKAFGEADSAPKFRKAMLWQLRTLIEFALEEDRALYLEVLYPLLLLEAAMERLDQGAPHPLFEHVAGMTGETPPYADRRVMMDTACAVVELIYEREAPTGDRGKTAKRAANGVREKAVAEVSAAAGIGAGALLSHYKKRKGKSKRSNYDAFYKNAMASRIHGNMTAGELVHMWKEVFGNYLANYLRFLPGGRIGSTKPLTRTK
jgi:hypothetical protein